MSTIVENLRLGELLYQLRAAPAIVASVANEPASVMRRNLIPDTGTSRGLTTARAYTPFGGVSRGFHKVRGGEVSLPIFLFAAALAVAAAGLAVASATLAPASAPIWLIAGLAAVAFVAEKQSVRINANTEVSVSSLPILFAATVCGPLPAMVVGACALLGEFRRPYARWIVWTSSRALAGGVAGFAASLIIDADPSVAALLLGVVTAALTEGAVDSMLVSATARLRGNGSFLGTMETMLRLLAATVPLHAPVVAVLAYAYLAVSPWVLFLFFVPTLASQRLLVLYQEQRRLTGDVLAANERLESANLSFAGALVSALDARDRYTAGHSAAVAIYARDIARALSLDDQTQREAHLAGLLHDIGKVGLPPGILEKEGPLTPDERRSMETHSEIGERILRNVSAYGEIATVVRHHHERVDGRGYPDGLLRDEIPLLSRIIAVADAYNAMTSGRPYRTALPTANAKQRLDDASGSQFDSNIVRVFQEILETESAAYSLGARADFALEAQRHPRMFTSPALTAA
jgi:putative nucleotidyltransferase with HDIG domain